MNILFHYFTERSHLKLEQKTCVVLLRNPSRLWQGHAGYVPGQGDGGPLGGGG